ncbi:fused 4'-phosphopantothenoylcysteine decarboxylase; phosphopantothenoylcysteine synthetase, FMN-binding(Coenzyme A biosynthesis bifunctional protein CoaBC,2-394) [Magnetospirillum sp. XM-1]|uniref:bifunctional phosphopantothenoylcysteine decarboxylase/phosphopantothenate--cysteine ligase CoaBC n=1 Tax=Magnetospirillum sp. XM-1 TaxID=1663591 RepID=UPI00073DF1EC|nr:bifunctional phosphopantothenoylcysteine decarboxylase/phosphopantothenate--cysteine ligase CoaBC [Magnetospirillum sp. XM-1]CUW38234.1 fused 4'-phosphopantothenoylcysteine decarboxylase; phosphopantothenoylcysteine synthetase, FMN-binding(Coenzyme A biosynthesis bifunctional protein CoaBC,2-394) [Magnetospirillum sp. XM-1]
MLDGRRVLLIISGGIAAYKSLELIRRLKDRGCAVRCILTKGGANFVTPLSVAALSGDKVYQETFSLTDEAEMGHIRLSREADLVVVAPATANLLAKMAAGIADDLASTALLATDKRVLVAPAMNTMMWEHAATKANMAILEGRGVARVGPGAGDLACGEVGAGRMAEPAEILAAIGAMLSDGPLSGVKAVVTSGPTHEAIDPVRFIANRSSGKQGHAIAGALAALGAEVTLVSGPVTIPDPAGMRVVKVESAIQMLNAVRGLLPADVVVCAAAVADWTVANRATEKRKKKVGDPPPTIELTPNPDILMTVSKAEGPARPRLVVGFAAETEKLLEHAADKRARKGCDWIVANDVSEGSGTFGGDANTVHVMDGAGTESWPAMGKDEVARRLAERIARALGKL